MGEVLGESQRFLRFAACVRRLRGGGGGPRRAPLPALAGCGVRPERMRWRRFSVVFDLVWRPSYQMNPPTATIMRIAANERNSSVLRPLSVSPARLVLVTLVSVDCGWPTRS